MSNELNLIQEAEGNSLFEFLGGLPYTVCGLVVVRKAGSSLEIEADPWGWLVAVTPLDDELDALIRLCVAYEAARAKGAEHFEAAQQALNS